MPNVSVGLATVVVPVHSAYVLHLYYLSARFPLGCDSLRYGTLMVGEQDDYL